MASDIIMTVDTALTGVPVNLHPLTDDTDFKTREESVVYNQSGLDLVWNFVTVAGVASQTAVTPTTAGDYDWTNLGNGLYTIEIPASGGASINNDTEGTGWFTGYATGILPWTGPRIQFVPVNVSAALVTGGYLDVNTVNVGGTSAATFFKNNAKFETTIATYTSNTSFVLTDKPPDDNSLNDWTYIVTDQTTAEQKGTGYVTDYAGTTGTAGTVTNVDTSIFTYAVGDTVTYYPPGTVHPGQIRAALGMASADLDTQLDAIVADTSTLGTPAGADFAADIAAVKSDTAAILTDTGTTIPAQIGTPVGADISADIAAVKSDTAAILTDTGTTIPAQIGTPVNADISADIAAVKTDTAAVKVVTDLIANAAGTYVDGTVDTVTNTHTPTTTEFQADNITEATADHFKDRVIMFTSGALQYQAKAITAYSLVGGIGQFTTNAFTEAPANNDTFVIM